jgi:hypothetical protein
MNFKLQIVSEVLVKVIVSKRNQRTQENTTKALTAKKRAIYSVG